MTTRMKAVPPPTKRPDVVDQDAALVAAVPELLQVRDDSMTFREWMTTLTPFFTQAKQLEVEAKETLALAKRLVPPTNGAQDTAIQTFIRQASAAVKQAEAHWTVTAMLFNFQRRLVTVRKRTTDPLTEAQNLAQDLHNRYVEKEKQRVAEENRRRQQEADEQAARERQAELDRIEAAALKAEAQSPNMSDRERVFVVGVIGGTAAMYAARDAGYKDYVKQSERLMKDPKILGAIDAGKTAKALRDQAAAKAAVPVRPAEIQEEKADVGGAGSDRNTKSMEVLDEAELVAAVIAGRHGIPTDLLMINPVKGNQYARDFGEVINRWPGVRLKKKVTTV